MSIERLEFSLVQDYLDPNKYTRGTVLGQSLRLQSTNSLNGNNYQGFNLMLVK